MAPGPQPDRSEHDPRVAAALGGLDPRQLDPALAGLVDSGDPFGGDLPGTDRPKAEDVLRPRRDDVVTYRVRVDLDDVDPPVWRRLELASDTGLPTLHEVLQAAMGWTDSHLHRFAVGAPVFSRGALELLAPFDVSEGNPGTAEADVRLDEVMAEVGDRLHYAYDFGDGWEHTLRLEAVLPRADDVPTARCTAGGRACPPEDVGGIPGYEALCAVIADPDLAVQDPDLAERRAWAGPFDPAAFDVEATDAAVRMAATTVEPAPHTVPPQVAELLARASGPGRSALVRLVAAARLDVPDAPPEDAEVTTATSAYRRLLDLVGADGVKLTSAGYLPPAVVGPLIEEIDPERSWLTNSNREVDYLPVLLFRTSAERLRLVRKVKGRLVLSPAGRSGRSDPAALLAHVTARLLLAEDAAERDAALLVLLAVAGGSTLDSSQRAAHELVGAMGSLGWSRASGVPLSANDIVRTADATVDVLHAVRALSPLGAWTDEPVPAPGAAFARRAVRG